VFDEAQSLPDSVAARDQSDVPRAVTAPPSPVVAVSRGVDRVPDRLKVERTVPLPPPIRDRAPYHNPDRRQRLAKNGRLRADLEPD